MATPTPPQAELLSQARVARLATADIRAEPHVIPICFIYFDECIYSAVDMKPKRTGAMGLKRVRNILANPQVAVVIDHYEEDWGQLWYLLVRGRGEILQSGAEHDRAIKHLRDKYPQYRAMELGGRPLIKITPTTMVSWRGAAD